MKKVILAASMLAASIAVAQPEQTDRDKFELMMSSTGINYILQIRDTGDLVYVFNDTDPRAICELADQFPDVTVETVTNYTNDTIATCKVPTGTAI